MEVLDSADEVVGKRSGLIFIEFILGVGDQVEESVLHILKHEVDAFDAALLIIAVPLFHECIKKFCSENVWRQLVEICVDRYFSVHIDQLAGVAVL